MLIVEAGAQLKTDGYSILLWWGVDNTEFTNEIGL